MSAYQSDFNDFADDITYAAYEDSIQAAVLDGTAWDNAETSVVAAALIAAGVCVDYREVA